MLQRRLYFSKPELRESLHYALDAKWVNASSKGVEIHDVLCPTLNYNWKRPYQSSFPPNGAV
jgi:hypothetical protein